MALDSTTTLFGHCWALLGIAGHCRVLLGIPAKHHPMQGSWSDLVR
jgi:hypothetical protein